MIRVGVDVSPLRQTNAGTARAIAGVLAQPMAEIERVELGFGRAGRLGTLELDLAWYPFLLGRRARGLDVLHCPTYRAPADAPVPVVVTVHDLAVFRFPEAFGRWTRAYSRRAVPRAVRAARLVLAVSEFTKREAVELLGLPEEKVRVVPNGIEPVFRPDGASAPGDYVLAVGTLEPRKNLPRLAAAARRLGVELRVAGAQGWGDVPLEGVDAARRGLGRGARPPLPRRPLPRLPVALRGLRDPGARGDGLRHSRGDERPRGHCGDRGRRGRARRSARSRGDRGRDRGGRREAG